VVHPLKFFFLLKLETIPSVFQSGSFLPISGLQGFSAGIKTKRGRDFFEKKFKNGGTNFLVPPANKIQCIFLTKTTKKTKILSIFLCEKVNKS